MIEQKPARILRPKTFNMTINGKDVNASFAGLAEKFQNIGESFASFEASFVSVDRFLTHKKRRIRNKHWNKLMRKLNGRKSNEKTSSRN